MTALTQSMERRSGNWLKGIPGSGIWRAESTGGSLSGSTSVSVRRKGSSLPGWTEMTFLFRRGWSGRSVSLRDIRSTTMQDAVRSSSAGRGRGGGEGCRSVRKRRIFFFIRPLFILPWSSAEKFLKNMEITASPDRRSDARTMNFSCGCIFRAVMGTIFRKSCSATGRTGTASGRGNSASGSMRQDSGQDGSGVWDWAG